MNDSIHPDFERLLALKDPSLQSLYHAVRAVVLGAHPDGNELLYHTHALTSVYSTSLKLKNGYCHIPIYTEHLNLGFNFGAMLDDPLNLLQGTGRSIRHIPIRTAADLESPGLNELIGEAVGYSLLTLGIEPPAIQTTVSKIKTKG